MVQQDPNEVALLVSSLEAASGKSRGHAKSSFTCKKSTFAVAGTKDVTVDSWKFMDWDYKRRDLPTYARGLFTTERQDGTPEIAVRGYDKFFNVDEVHQTVWQNIQQNTRGPYELSVKENGCIIFISGLEDGTLLVCSKHSTGVRSDAEVSHAQAGERWVEHHVSSVGKSARDLARELRRLNATAVGELCDDSFEEHVLAYDEAASGIYIHGINFNVPEFATLPSADVHKFADAWGFKKANFLVLDEIHTVKSFLEECAQTGTWNGRETEGFVIRCQLSEDGGKRPYRDWFFKYKFEEPYLMYRQWRECTKAVIGGKLPRIKKHKQITEEYLQYARRQLNKNPQLAKLYNQNHGIIAMRDGFLKERGLKGSDIIAMEKQGEGSGGVTKNVILAPIASLGCGKTTVALALVKLFGWGHVQNDNIPKQKNKPKRFAFDVCSLLSDHPVVIADRNNHQKRERQQLMDDVLPVLSDARFVALHWVHEPKGELLPGIREVTRRRVLERGDNHQTIRAGSKGSEEVIGIMEGFLTRFEGVNTERDPDRHFDQVINLNVASSSRENLEKIVRSLHAAYPAIVERVPSAQELDDAIAAAMTDYHVDVDLSGGYGPKKPKEKKPAAAAGAGAGQGQQQQQLLDPETLAKKIEYFSISVPTTDILTVLHSIFSDPSLSNSPEKTRMYHHLVNSRCLQPAFHVTLIHRASKSEHPHLWERYTEQYIARIREIQHQNIATPTTSTTPTLASLRVRIERLVWDDRVMAFIARILPADDSQQTLQQEWVCANRFPHITVGTAAPEVKPKESNDLLQRWVTGGSGPGTGIWEAEVPGVKVVSGVVTVVMRR
ncbi:hypothetical protein ASPZODRAFT_983397 [Penicilliopsis zonata CBS 506.65]|uniref:tRNA ligase n=1 Tax=Penicilliopsis zonata CBS 506.65 TaxID=1073090 RepID=A0A1L9SR33_9EURO|nr:hypothetical protein ASPZODRAFT_983397 [Penicilliopsis zonata CBS 506.65]OJJ49618.1 hypothetical protein ASPZODRAFT_983397 [Penicilliopsis zonata CBS 506.65]